MPELKELFDVTTGHMHPPQVDPWKEQERRQVRARRTRTIGAIAVVAAIAVGVALAVIASRPDPAAPVPATDPPVPVTVFSWDGGDLSEWVSEDEMTDAIREASALYEGPGPVGEAVYEPPGANDDPNSAAWRVSEWSIGVHKGGLGGEYAGPLTRTDPRLPEGVTYEAEEGFGAGGFIFSGPNSEEMIAIYLWWPGGPWGDRPSMESVHEEMSFALASRLLREMGWADQPVFDFSEDSLCDWFTEDDMNRIVTAAQERAGTDWPVGPFEHCRGGRTETDGYHWSWGPVGGHLRVSLQPIDWFGQQRSTDPMPTADHFTGHEMLDGSVTHGDIDYLCSWNEIVRGQLRVEGHEDEVLWFDLQRSDPTSSCGGETQVTSFGLAVADAMLREMNWVESS
jgi:hypothetical protein